MNVREKQHSVFGIISVGIAVVLVLLFANWHFHIVPFKNSGISFFLPVFIAPVGIVFGLIGFFRQKGDKLSIWGTISNMVLFVFPHAFWIITVLIKGP